jgi:membrane protein DedA with SNARE-associated domain
VEILQELAATFALVMESVAGLVTDSPLTYLLILGMAALDVLLPILPAEGVVLLAALLAGTGQLSIALVVAAAGTGAFIGDNLAYWVGRTGGRPFIARLLPGEDRLRGAEARFQARGGSLIIVGRFVPGGRSAVAVGAGVLQFPWRRFVAFDLVAAALWSLQAALPGFLGGSAFPDRPWIGLVVGIGLALVITGGIEVVRRVMNRSSTRVDGVDA